MGKDQAVSDLTVTEYVRSDRGGAGGAEGVVDSTLSATTASRTSSSISFLHCKRFFLQRQHQQNAMMVRPPPVRKGHPLAQGMKFPLVFDSGSGSGSDSGSGSGSGSSSDSASVGFGDGLYVAGPPVGAYDDGRCVGRKIGLALGLPASKVGVGVG